MTVDPSLYKDAVLEMLSVADERVSADKLFDRNYWLNLNPHLSVGTKTDSAALEATPIPADAVDRICEGVKTRGYLHTPPTLSLGVTEDLLKCVATLRQEHLPPAFCFVYDEAWLVWSLPSLVRLLGSVLGEGYKQISRMWCHYVPPVPGTGGWAPHSDGGGVASRRMTLWIPLSDATLDNGCVYVLPRDMLPAGVTLATGDAQTLLRAAKALPARAGEVLGWDHELIHWGSFCSHAPGSPRISLSMEFIARGEAPGEQEVPLIDVGTLPTFQERLYFISRGALTYSRFEPQLLRVKDAMERVEHESRPSAAPPI